jgi:TRAP-type C4-dicarboxylate transport system substrate-binding protein
MPLTEVYPALDKGILDGVCVTAETLKSMNFAEVTKYSTNLHLAGPPAIATCMNQDSWNSLTPDIQKVFEDSIPWVNAEMDKILLQVDQEAIDWAKTQGHEFIELSPEDLNRLYSIMEEIALGKAVELNTKGLPGTAIFEKARLLIENYSKK